MADRSNAQKIGAQGHRWVMALIEKHPDWLARDLGEDFGIDAEAELTSGGLKGEILKLQFKSSEQVSTKDGRVQFEIERKYIEYAKSCRYPVIFIRIDLSAEQAWYMWLQDWILQERAAGNYLTTQDSFTVWVNDSSTFLSGLDSYLKRVAKWQGETQLVLSLLDALRAAAATYRPDFVDHLVDLLSEAAPMLADTSLDVMLREAILLGDRLKGTDDGLAIARYLFSLVRRFGERMTIETIDAMVRREESYSRTGLTGLAILYDEYFGHASSLRLTEHFLKHGLPHVAYYCALREANPGKRDIEFLNGPGEFTFAGLRFAAEEQDRFWDRFANRGPSAILDYLVPEESSS